MPTPKHISGKDGTISLSGGELANIVSWNLELEVPINSRGTNSSEGWKRSSTGVAVAKGKLKLALTDAAPPALHVGETYEANFAIDDSSSYTGDIVIGGMSGLEVDMDEGKDVTVEYSWQSDGPLTAGGNAPNLLLPAGP